VGKARGRQTALTGNLSHGQGLGIVQADIINRGAHAAVEVRGLALGVGAIAAQDDFLQGIHGQFLPESVDTGI